MIAYFDEDFARFGLREWLGGLLDHFKTSRLKLTVLTVADLECVYRTFCMVMLSTVEGKDMFLRMWVAEKWRSS